MSHYIAIFVEDHIGEWRVVFPDVPGCEARGFTLHDAQYAAASTLARCPMKTARRYLYQWIWRQWKNAMSG